MTFFVVFESDFSKHKTYFTKERDLINIPQYGWGLVNMQTRVRSQAFIGERETELREL